jgi:hypothetical protein
MVANCRIHLTRRAVTALVEKHRRQVHHPVPPGPRRTSPAGDTKVSILRSVQDYHRMAIHALLVGVLAVFASAALA